MRAVMTFARGWNALAAARSLGRRGIEVVAGDEYGFAPAMFSKYTVGTFRYPNPDRDPEGFLDRLEEVIRENRPADGQYALLTFHKETYLIAKHRERFEPLIGFALPSIEQIEQVHDKGTLARICIEQGIPTPRAAVPSSPDEARGIAEGFSYPAFVKLRRSAAAVGVKKVERSKEAVEQMEKWAKKYHLPADGWPMLQSAVPGDDYCSTFLFEKGELRASMTYHNLRTYPVKSGTGVLRETVRADRMEAIGADLLSKLGWHGVAEIDFRWTGGDDDVNLIEVNPRFWGGLPQSIHSGWDYPYLLYELAVNGTVGKVEAHDSSVRTETPLMAILASLHEVVHDEKRMESMRRAYEDLRRTYVRGGRRRALRTFFNRFTGAVDLRGRFEQLKSLLRDHKHTVNDVFTWKDPMPAFGVFFPLAVFLKHGKISTELLVEGLPAEAEAEEEEEGDEFAK